VYQAIFKRYEIEYRITREQKTRLLEVMAPHMALDQYGRTTIRNIYFDTDNYRLIRRSLDKPAYKEKLRIRSYRQVAPEDPVFVELKKKYQSVVYKRRLSMPEQKALQWLCQNAQPCPQGQIAGEIDYFRQFYETLRPTVFLSYEREAYYCRHGGDFRVTFDDHILCRTEELSLEKPAWGTPLLEDGTVLMEIKTAGGIPMWMTQALSAMKIYKTSFSKYGKAYETMILPECKGDYLYV